MGRRSEWDVERELGVSPGSGAAGPCRRLRREAKIRLHPTLGGWSGKPHPEGLTVFAGQQQ